jgi:hypothetical protein
MTNPVLLNNVDHHGLRVILRHGADHGDATNQLLVFPTEFDAVGREFPILFRRDQDRGWIAVALLGFDRDENLFLEGDAWTSRHVPAIQQRGPFSIALSGPDGDPQIRIDLDDPRVSRDDGLPLFLPQGGNSPYLEHVAGVLRAVFNGHRAMAPMFAAFEEAGLIRPVTLDVQLDDAKRVAIPEVFTIDEERLATLDGPALETLNRAGFLRAAFLAAASLGNLARLIDLKNRKAG